MKPFTLFWIVITTSLFSTAPMAGQITTDGTVGATKSLTGPSYTIPQSLGSTVGKNLFHSFGQFNLDQGDIARFTGANTLQNVISRVTGGSVSNIDGMIKSEIGNADFYFLNPAGVIFGKNTQIDVPAAFHVSTAQELRFADGAKYSAIMPVGSTLSIAKPEAFGYLGKTGDIEINNGQLVFKEGSSVTLAGGSVKSNNAILSVPAGTLRVYAQGDTVGAVSVNGDLPKGNGAITVTGKSGNTVGNFDTSGDSTGNLWLSGGAMNINGALLYNHNTGTKNAIGETRLDANTLSMDSGAIKNRVYSTGNGTNVFVNVSSDMQVQNSGGISTSVYDTTSFGTAGNLFINVGGDLNVLSGGFIGSQTSGSGDSGNVSITAGNLVIDGAGQTENPTWIYTAATETGNAGDVLVKAGNLSINGGALLEQPYGIGIVSETLSTGNSGKITVKTDGDMKIQNGGEISTSTLLDIGNAADIDVAASNLTIDGGAVHSAVIGSGAFSAGNTGNVIINSGQEIQVLNGGGISTLSFDQGKRGNVTVTVPRLIIDGGAYGIAYIGRLGGNSGNVVLNVADEIQILNGGSISSDAMEEGEIGNITLNTGRLIIDGESENVTGINTSTASNGAAGKIDIHVDHEMQIKNRGWVTSSTFGDGPGGTIKIKAGNLIIDGSKDDSYITTSSQGSRGRGGNAGDIQIDVDGEIQLIGSANDIYDDVNGKIQFGTNGYISSSTFSTGDAGNIQLIANQLTVDGGNIQATTGPSSTGVAGKIEIDVSDIQLLNGGEISSDSVGSTNKAGSVIVNAERLTINGGSIKAETIPPIRGEIPSGSAGDVVVTVTDKINLQNRGEILSTTSTKGKGGNVTVIAGSLIIDNGIVSSEAKILSEAQGGTVNVNIIRDAHILNRGVISSANEGSGDAGYVLFDVGGRLNLIDGKVTTSAQTGHGGPIKITAPLVVMKNSQITTSVFGEKGNGGDIQITGNYLVMDTGFIQANTAAQNAKGGDIVIDELGVIGQGGKLTVGGKKRAEFIADSGDNIIQAASPNGESGTITLTHPDANPTAGLIVSANLSMDTKHLLRDVCKERKGRGRLRLKRSCGTLPIIKHHLPRVKTGGAGIH